MVSTCSGRSSAHARQVVESSPPEKSTRAERESIIWGYGVQPFGAPWHCDVEGFYTRKGGRMFVSDILAQKGGLVFTVTPGTTLAQIGQQLTTRRIGSVLVMADADRVAG